MADDTIAYHTVFMVPRSEKACSTAEAQGYVAATRIKSNGEISAATPGRASKIPLP